MLTGPIVLTSANRSGEADPVTAEEVLAALESEVDLVLNDGHSRLGQPSTVVKVGPKDLHVLRQGVVSEQTLRRSAFLSRRRAQSASSRAPIPDTSPRASRPHSPENRPRRNSRLRWRIISPF